MLWWHLRSLQSDDQRARIAACKALGRTHHQRAMEALIASLSDGDLLVVAAAVEALGNMHAAAAVDHLVTMVRRSDPAGYHLTGQQKQEIAAKRRLFSFGLSATNENEEEALRRMIAETRSGIAHALGEIGDPSVAETLTSIATDVKEDARVREAAAHALRRLGKALSPETTAAITVAKGDIEGAREFGHAAVGPLCSALRAGRGDTRLMVQLLGEIGDPAAVDSLSQYLKDRHDVYTYRATLRALADIGNQPAISSILSFLRTTSYDNGEAIEALDTVLRDPQRIDLESLMRMALLTTVNTLHAYEKEDTGELVVTEVPIDCFMIRLPAQAELERRRQLPGFSPPTTPTASGLWSALEQRRKRQQIEEQKQENVQKWMDARWEKYVDEHPELQERWHDTLERRRTKHARSEQQANGQQREAMLDARRRELLEKRPDIEEKRRALAEQRSKEEEQRKSDALRRQREDQQRQQEVKQKQLAMDMEKREQERILRVQEQRQRRGQCCMCGKPLSRADRQAKKTKHSACSTFQE